jgi:hypothetical protein
MIKSPVNNNKNNSSIKQVPTSNIKEITNVSNQNSNQKSSKGGFMGGLNSKDMAKP